MDSDAVQDRLRFALVLADEVAARILRAYSPLGVRFDTKSDGTPVTVADRDAEAHIRSRVERAYPGDAFLGEEFGEGAGSSGFRWIVDPIDGTKSFVAGVPLFGTLIGLERNNRCVAGVIHLPVLNEQVYAAATEGCWHRVADGAPRRVRVSNVPCLAEATTVMSSPGCLCRNGSLATMEQLAKGSRLLRGWGDCFGYAMVATGRAEAAIDQRVAIWDVAALVPIITEAGGELTDWSGTPGHHITSCVATNARVHPEVLAILKQRA
ncbi:MAG: inositol monophosphatase family protein [Phycisphaerales bacterium]